ncbi:MAG: hypothetical protein MUC88_25055 [Planctomycetes bacterium]|nr:hypothetical protein [Planctomycetota bacterium]
MAISGTGHEITRVEVSTDGGLTWTDAALTSAFVPNPTSRIRGLEPAWRGQKGPF